jgi:hypothetical protein
MATTNFVDQATIITATWLNEVDGHVFDQAVDAHIAANITFTPAGNIAATDVQAAIEELESDTAALLAQKQPLDATLTSLASLGTATDKFAYTTGVDTWAEATISTFGRSLIDDADAAAAATTLEATSAATASKLMIRDANGRAKVANGVDADDIAAVGQLSNGGSSISEVTVTPPTDAPYTLTEAEYSASKINLVLTNWTADRQITVPAEDRRWSFYNTSSTRKAYISPSAGLGKYVETSTSRFLECDGANVVDPLSAYGTKLETGYSSIRVHTSNGHGSTNTKIRRFTTTAVNQGSDITYADSATLGSSFTINATGMYVISYSDVLATGQNVGVSVNSTQLTTDIQSITTANRLVLAYSSAIGETINVAVAAYLSAGDVVRPHTQGSNEHDAQRVTMTISRVG